jgi:phage gp45-like
VAENKPTSTHDILAVPYEKQPYLDGQIKSNPTKVTATGVDADGNAFHASATTDMVIKATWLKGSNTGQQTAPDVQRGERVQLYRYADTDKYYWISLGLDDHLRRGETVIRTYSGTLDPKEDGSKPGNCWYSEVSTHTGVATFATSVKNGEAAGYIIQLNAKKGVFKFQDSNGNHIEVDSLNSLILLVNAQQTAIALNQKNLQMSAPDSISIQATDNIVMKAGKAFSINAGTTVAVESGTTMSLKAGSDASINATNLNITAETNVDGNLTVSNGKTASFGGSCTFTGTVAFEKPITANGISSSAPVTAPNI